MHVAAGQHLEAREVVGLDGAGAVHHEGADRGGRGVELVDTVLRDHLPRPPRVGVCGDAFKHHRRRAVEERPVRHVRVARHPAAVAGAPVDIPRLDAERVLHGGRGIHHVPASGMLDALRVAGRAAGVEEEEGVL